MGRVHGPRGRPCAAGSSSKLARVLESPGLLGSTEAEVGGPAVDSSSSGLLRRAWCLCGLCFAASVFRFFLFGIGRAVEAEPAQRV
jgi:hypothetical protein